MVAVNRTGSEAPLTFYGSSFVSDPYGRVLVQAPRDEPAVLVVNGERDLIVALDAIGNRNGGGVGWVKKQEQGDPAEAVHSLVFLDWVTRRTGIGQSP